MAEEIIELRVIKHSNGIDIRDKNNQILMSVSDEIMLSFVDIGGIVNRYLRLS